MTDKTKNNGGSNEAERAIPVINWTRNKIIVAIITAIVLAVASYFGIPLVLDTDDTEPTEVGMLQSAVPSATLVDSAEPVGLTMPIKFVRDSAVLQLGGSEFLLKDERGGAHLGNGQYDPATGELFLYIGPTTTMAIVKDSLTRRQETAMLSSADQIAKVLDGFAKE